MRNSRNYLLLVSLLLLSCICLAQSGRQTTKANEPKVAGPKTGSLVDEASTAKTSPPKIPLLVALSRPRRLVMLPPANEFYAEQVVRNLRMQDRLNVEFDPQKVKVEDAQAMLRAKPKYMVLLRFEEFDDRDDSESCDKTDSKLVKSYKMDYTLLAPEGKLVKKRTVQTFFTCARNVKPLFDNLLVKNCVNRSRSTLDDPAVQCMAQHVVNDLYNFERLGK